MDDQFSALKGHYHARAKAAVRRWFCQTDNHRHGVRALPAFQLRELYCLSLSDRGYAASLANLTGLPLCLRKRSPA
jgi:hypothetical protein